MPLIGDIMEKLKIFLVVALLLASALIMAPANAVKAETLVWSGDVYSSGATVTSPVLESGKVYRIVASEIFWYDYGNNLAADAQYYTTDGSSNWNWVNHFPAPDGHSFLQINEMDQNWGPFSNGDTGHTYAINYAGQGEAIRFRIVDWIDDDCSNNYCHLPVCIYEIGETGKVTGGGQCVVGDNDKIPSASFGFNAMWFSRNPAPNGEINYVDHITGQHVHVHQLTYLVVWEDEPGNKPWPMQKAIFGGIDVYSGHMVDVYVEDNGEPGKNDKFLIFLNGEYLGGSGDYFGSVQTGNTILAGNIQIHKPPK